MCDNHFFAVCVTTGHDVSKAQEFFDIVDEQFRVDDIPWKWSIAVSVGVDNTNSMIGRNNSSAILVYTEKSIYFCKWFSLSPGPHSCWQWS